MEPTWPQKSTKIDPKFSSDCQPFFGVIFERSWSDLWSIFASPIFTRIYKFLRENDDFLKNRPPQWLPIFTPIWAPTWLRFGTKNHQKSIKNRTRIAIKISIDFCIDFGAILGPFWGPRWGHFRSFLPENAPPEASGAGFPPGGLRSASEEPPGGPSGEPFFHQLYKVATT